MARRTTGCARDDAAAWACTVVVGEHDVYVYRGDDRLRVPPEARLYAHGERLTLVWFGPYGRTEIRKY